MPSPSFRISQAYGKLAAVEEADAPQLRQHQPRQRAPLQLRRRVRVAEAEPLVDVEALAAAAHPSRQNMQPNRKQCRPPRLRKI
jgi:hypothetical protein